MPRPEQSWTEHQEELDRARVLADFANLESDDLDGFRAAHPDFFPQGWWEYEPTYAGGTLRKQWQITQKFLREAWQSQFEIELYDYLKILQSIFNPDHVIRAVDRRWTGPPNRPAFADMWDILWERHQTKPHYYLAIKFLSGNGWRAKTCLYCGRRFIAESANGRFCNFGDVTDIDGLETKCFLAHRKKYQRDDWEENKNEVNARRREEYAKRVHHRNHRSSKSQPRMKRR